MPVTWCCIPHEMWVISRKCMSELTAPCSAAEVQTKLRFATELLEGQPERLALSPRLLFCSSLPDRIGPRFAFVKAHGMAAGLAPATLLKSTDEVCLPGPSRPGLGCHALTQPSQG